MILIILRNAEVRSVLYINTRLTGAGFVNEELIVEFFDDVVHNCLRLIINSNSSQPMYEFPIHAESMEEQTAYLRSHYCAVQDIDS